jgi:hypothetical protein
LIDAQAGLGAHEDGRLIHEQLIQSGFALDVFVGLEWLGSHIC